MHNNTTIKPHFSANIDNEFNLCEPNVNMIMLNMAVENDNNIHKTDSCD